MATPDLQRVCRLAANGPFSKRPAQYSRPPPPPPPPPRSHPDPYVEVVLCDDEGTPVPGAVALTTRYIVKTLHPYWNEVLVLGRGKGMQVETMCLRITVKDWDLVSGDDSMGFAVVSLWSLSLSHTEQTDIWVPLQYNETGPIGEFLSKGPFAHVVTNWSHSIARCVRRSHVQNKGARIFLLWMRVCRASFTPPPPPLRVRARVQPPPSLSPHNCRSSDLGLPRQTSLDPPKTSHDFAGACYGTSRKSLRRRAKSWAGARRRIQPCRGRSSWWWVTLWTQSGRRSHCKSWRT